MLASIRRFETVCEQWIVRANAKGELPFLASSLGRWRGTVSRDGTETDIDLIALIEGGMSGSWGRRV